MKFTSSSHKCPIRGITDVRNHIKGILYPKMEILLSFTNLNVLPNLYEFLSSV